MKISLTDAAYDYLKTMNTAVAFAELYAAAAEKAGLNEDMKKRKKNSFYSQLSLDSRFTQGKNNTWDLKENHSFEETHIKVEEIDTDDDDEDENEEMDEESDDSEESGDTDDDPRGFEASENNDEY